MAVPKRKTSTSKRNMRRANHALKKINVVENANGEFVLPHHVSADGTYNGRTVLQAADEDAAEASANA